jgi:pimeloyl-ACP methyl ester carboxylesterase
MARIESLLSARLFIAPQLVRDRIFFISNLGGHLSLYAMDYGGSVPEPLLPPHIALQNPHLTGGHPYYVLPDLDTIIVMLDQDGDENYQPMLIPMNGGFPEPSFNNFFKDYRVHMGGIDQEKNIAYFVAESRKESMNIAYQAHMATGELVELAKSTWGAYPGPRTPEHDKVLLIESYTIGDQVLILWEKETGEQKLIYGTPIDKRSPDEKVELPGFMGLEFTPNHQNLLTISAVHNDAYDLGLLGLEKGSQVEPVKITGIVHSGVGEMNGLEHIKDNLYALFYNIDGDSWLYEGTFDEKNREMKLAHVICGEGPLEKGVLESMYYDKRGDAYILSFSSATSPTQIYTVNGPARNEIVLHTRERVLGIPNDWMSTGEDASFTSFDGLRISARLYLPSETLGFEGPRPLVYYIHGGPQSQERPDFAWFSMPLIQFLTMQGFAVFVPNVRGSSGYGLKYMKLVDRDWGGDDRLDHVHAMTEILPNDSRLDVGRAGVVGRSYGGYMTLTLAARHPELWSAAVDMFGPYDLLSFMDRIPETWKPYFAIAVGDPEKDHDFLVERSPRTYIDQIACPMLVIQGKNDPRVVERESRDVVEYLREIGKEVDYLVFENEGHDVLKYENRVTCYNAITDFFKKHMTP